MLAAKTCESFFSNLQDAQHTQKQLLLETLQKNSDTAYGKRHDFVNCSSVDAFRQTVPLATFENLRPFVEAMAKGEKNQLTSERVLAFFKTSGSMSSPKLIPVTPSFLREKSRAFAVYWDIVYQQHPSVKGGRTIANFNDSGGSERTAGNTEVTSESTFWNRRTQGLHDRSKWPIPPGLQRIDDPLHRIYAAARLALQGPLHAVMTINPSSLLQFCRLLEEFWNPLLKGLWEGNWGRTDESFLRAMPTDLHQHLSRDPERARELEGKRSGAVDLQSVWPELEQIICWQSEIVRPYFSQLKGYTGTVPTRDYITQSSECIMAIPLRDNTSGGLLPYQSHFFEFIPQSDIESASPDTVLATETELGAIYELVATTGGGLYRYRTGDCIRVTGFQGPVPEIEFLYRAGRTSSLTGEKLTEFQIVEAVDRASRQRGQRPCEMLCFPRSGTLPHYAVLLHWNRDHRQDNSPEIMGDIRLWLQAFESELRAINPEYRDKCSSGRLGAMVGLVTSGEGFEAYRDLRRAAGVSDAQIKADALNATLDLDSALPILGSTHENTAD